MCIIMRWSRNHSATWAERFRTSSLLCTYKLCDYYSPITILSPFLFTPSLYAPILNLQDFSFTCTSMMGRTLAIPIYKALLCFVIGMTKVLPIINVLGYDGQNSSFSSSPPPYSDSTPITQKEAIYQHETLGVCRFL